MSESLSSWFSVRENGFPNAIGHHLELLDDKQKIHVGYYSSSVGWIFDDDETDSKADQIVVTHYRYCGPKVREAPVSYQLRISLFEDEVISPPPDNTLDCGLWEAMLWLRQKTDKWKRFRDEGLSDEEMIREIKFCFGEIHGWGGPNQMSYATARDGLKYWYGWLCMADRTDNGKARPPDLHGSALLKAVRRVLHIPERS